MLGKFQCKKKKKDKKKEKKEKARLLEGTCCYSPLLLD